jgi:hypothetical protein
MYILFKTVDTKTMGLVKRYGQFVDYVVGFVDDSISEIIDYSILNATVIDEDTANGWMFATSYGPTISVRPNTSQSDQLQIINSTELSNEKVKYTLTDANISNAVKFLKAYMQKVLNDTYDKRFDKLSPGNNLEVATWATQLLEAQQFIIDPTSPTPSLNTLATARGLTVAELSQRIVAASDNYTQQTIALLANKQIVQDEIYACNTITDANVLLHSRFQINMPYKLQLELGITEGSTLNL